MRKRVFEREFKLALCRQVESREMTQAQACREHDISPNLLARWREKYRKLGEDAFQGQNTPREISDKARIKMLEESLGRAHLTIDLLKEALSKKGSAQRRNQQ